MSSDRPLVSIGVPAYNRPDGLERTLSQLTAQTYDHLEIIVSDNASSDPDVARIGQSFADRDPRVRFHRQAENVGPTRNFDFLLREATGTFFMWAADDDEWDPRFVEACLGLHTDDTVSVMSHATTRHHATGIDTPLLMPAFDDTASYADNAIVFLKNLQPSLFYGLHRREAILFFRTTDLFDFFDCFCVFRMLLSGRIRIVPEHLYVAGIADPVYQAKSYKGAGVTLLEYKPFLREVKLTIDELVTDPADRDRLHRQVRKTGARMFVSHEPRYWLSRLKRLGR